MTNPMPLNGNRLLRSAEHALTRRPSTADLLRSALEGDQTDEDAPDGTGAGTKSYPTEQPQSAVDPSGRPQSAVDPSGQRRSAVDPSQGHGGSTRTGPTDPLHRALERLLLNR